MVTQCHICGKVFPDFVIFTRHMKWTHVKPQKCGACLKELRGSHGLHRHRCRNKQGENILYKEGTVGNQRVCERCRKRFRGSYGLHQRRCTAQGRGGSRCPLCQFAGSKSALREHFKVHGITLDFEVITLRSEEEFVIWKTDMERHSNTKFTRKHSPRVSKDGTITTVDYHCFRDGYFRSRGKGLRSLKEQGSNKINGYCPASLEVKKSSNGIINVLFIKTHVGHEQEVRQLDPSQKKKKKKKKITAETTSVVSNCSEANLAQGLSEKQCVEIILNCEEEAADIIAKDSSFSSVNVDRHTVCENGTLTAGDFSYSEGLDFGGIVFAEDLSMEEHSTEMRIEKEKLIELDKRKTILKVIKSEKGLQAFRRYMIPLASVMMNAEGETTGEIVPKTFITEESLGKICVRETDHNYPSCTYVHTETSYPEERKAFATSFLNTEKDDIPLDLIYISEPREH